MKQESGTIKSLASKILSSEYTVALTGAGVSTLSGLPDFRGKHGLYRDRRTRKMFDIDEFRRDPARFYTNAADLIYSLEMKHPSLVHRFLSRLEKVGHLKAVITQNIDMLHQKAGSTRVIEVHGSPAIHRCIDCADHYGYDEIAEVARQGRVPLCRECGGVLKPDITFFGEMLPMNALEQAWKEAARASLMLVLGTSLTVNPAASIPLETIENGGEIIIVNASATPLDTKASLIYSDLLSVFKELAVQLDLE